MRRASNFLGLLIKAGVWALSLLLIGSCTCQENSRDSCDLRQLQAWAITRHFERFRSSSWTPFILVFPQYSTHSELLPKRRPHKLIRCKILAVIESLLFIYCTTTFEPTNKSSSIFQKPCNSLVMSLFAKPSALREPGLITMQASKYLGGHDCPCG